MKTEKEKLIELIQDRELIQKALEYTINQWSFDFVIFSNGETTYWTQSTSLNPESELEMVRIAGWDSCGEEDVTVDQVQEQYPHIWEKIMKKGVENWEVVEDFWENYEKEYNTILQKNIENICDCYIDETIKKLIADINCRY